MLRPRGGHRRRREPVQFVLRLDCWLRPAGLASGVGIRLEFLLRSASRLRKRRGRRFRRRVPTCRRRRCAVARPRVVWLLPCWRGAPCVLQRPRRWQRVSAALSRGGGVAGQFGESAGGLGGGLFDWARSGPRPASAASYASWAASRRARAASISRMALTASHAAASERACRASSVRLSTSAVAVSSCARAFSRTSCSRISLIWP